jgi:menaquinone-dependent protoporphyrinogen oxidase
MTTTLVAYASTHGSTAGLAGWIADELRAHGIDAWAVPAARISSLESIDAVVIGSAVYFGRWLPEATELVERHAGDLRAMPVWLFATGPTGTPDEGAHLDEQDRLASLVGARQARVFGGALDRTTASAEALELGDWRDEHEVRRWARDIADELAVVSSPA